jgi:predicted RNA binding protein YcfA (HicA-like mRNA interferase family)
VYKVCISLGKRALWEFLTRESIVLHSKDVIKDVIRALERDGWYRVGQTGSHPCAFQARNKAGEGHCPAPVKDLPIGTLKSIEKASGVKLR